MKEKISKLFDGIAPLLIFFILEIVLSFISCENQIVMRSRLDEIEREINWQKDIITSGREWQQLDDSTAVIPSGLRLNLKKPTKIDSAIYNNLPTRFKLVYPRK